MGEVCNIITKQTGFDYSSTIKPALLKEKADNTYPFIQNKDFNGTTINMDTDFFIPISVAEKFPNIVLDRPSILISISGRIGNVGFYSCVHRAFIGGAVGICKLKYNDDGKFIIHELESEYGQKYFYSLIKASSHANITVEDIRNIELIFPNQKEEKVCISTFFSTLDHLITLHQRKLEKLKIIKKSMLENLFPQNGEKTSKIRFSGFTKDWEQRKLGEIIQERNIRTSDFDRFPIFSLTIESGITPKTERYERSSLVTKTEDLFKVVKPNEFVTNPMNLRFGALGYNAQKYDVSVSGYYDVFSIDGNNCSGFWNAYFKTHHIMNVFDNVATGSLVEKKRVKYSTLKQIYLSVPTNMEEKNKISKIMILTDHLITLHQRKLEKLKIIKKSMLENLFPQNGEKTAKIRFSGFTKDWEQRKLSDLYEKVIEKNDLSFGTDKIISVANMYYKEDTSNSDDDYMRTYNVMRLGDIAFEGNKSKNFAHGRFVENTIGDGIVSHVFDVFRPISEYDLLFWKYFINYEGVMGRIMIRCTKASTMMTNLVAKDFLEESIVVPGIVEQKRIGYYLESLDHLITLHQLEPFQLIFKAIAYRIIDYAKSKPPRRRKYTCLISFIKYYI